MAKTVPTVSLEGRDSNSTANASTSLYGSRGSGRRQRHKFDPNKWTSSIPPRKTNVLCLGVSYPSVEAQLRREKISKRLQLFHPKPCVEQAVELVRRNILTEMDGRDLARCFSLESTNQTNAYCVSLESGAVYLPSRHLSANFNRKGFTKVCKQAFGKSIKFRQIILDYFWIPKGSWAMTHWQPEFFQCTLPSFVKDNLLDVTSIRSFLDTSSRADNVVTPDTATSLQEGGASGVVYLPFTLYCVSRIIVAYKELSACYSISFMNKSELSEHALWYATSQINPDTMQSWLGKAINQEDIYCTFLCSEVMQTSYKDITKEEIHNLLKRIQKFDEVRMIRLQALRSGEKGGFVGLQDFEQQKQTQTAPRETVENATMRKKKHLCIPDKARTKQTFFNKLMKLIKEKSKDFNDAVSWNYQGTHFSINVEEAFEHSILKQNFDGITFKEFESRLISCGFTKSEKGFSHKNFCRYNPEVSVTVRKESSHPSNGKNKEPPPKSVRRISHGSKATIRSENVKETEESRNSTPSFLEEKSISTLDGTSIPCDHPDESISFRNINCLELSLTSSMQNHTSTASIHDGRNTCAINSSFEGTKHGAIDNVSPNDLKIEQACNKRRFICTETGNSSATLPCVYASSELSKSVPAIKQQRTLQFDSCTSSFTMYDDDCHTTRLIPQMRAESPGDRSTSIAPHVNYSYGLCKKGRFLESNHSGPTFIKRKRADADPNEISSDTTQALVNRFVPEDSLLTATCETATAPLLATRTILSQSWDSTSRLRPNQHVYATPGGSAYSVMRTLPSVKSPQTQMMHSSPWIGQKPSQSIEPTAYFYPCISQHASYHTTYQNNHNFYSSDGDGTGLDVYEPRVTRSVKDSPPSHQYNTCRTSNVIRNSYTIAGSKNELKEMRLLPEWEILGEIFRDIDSSSKSVSTNIGFDSADVEDFILSYAARALLLMKTC